MPNIIGIGLSPTGSGLRKSLVVDVEETINAIASSLKDPEPAPKVSPYTQPDRLSPNFQLK